MSSGRLYPEDVSGQFWVAWLAAKKQPGAGADIGTEQAALKCLYLVTRSLDPPGKGKVIWAMRWKPALNAVAITFGDRFPAAETY